MGYYNRLQVDRENMIEKRELRRNGATYKRNDVTQDNIQAD